MSLKEIFSAHRVVLFLYGTVDQPKDKFSKSAVSALIAHGVDFFPVDITSNLNLRFQVQAYSGWTKFPQLFVDGEFIGGSFVISEFLRSGELDRILKDQINNCHEIPTPQLPYKPHHTDAIWSVKISPDRSFVASGSADGTIRIWDIHTAVAHRVLAGHSGWVNCIAITPDSKFIVSGSTDTTIRVWSVEDGSECLVLRGHTRWVNALSIAPDGERLVSVSADRTLRLWSLSSGTEIGIAYAHNDCIWSVCITSDGQYAITSSADKNIVLWDVDGLKCKKIITNAHRGTITSIEQRGTEAYFLSAAYDSTMKEWDYEGCLIHTYEGHTERIWSIASKPDGQLLATVGADKKAILWQPGKSKKQELLLQDIPTACALSPDGRWLIIGFRSGKLEWRTLPNFTEMDFKPSQR
jgi:WD40 repeat protein/glutaredoxin-related protein